jgi:hypothetical protein
MRVVVSVQAKQASPRGLVHYVAHSKIDAGREPRAREIFNSYADSLSVEKANLFLKSGASLKRPANGELHHLVFSLKTEDYERLGAIEAERQESLKKITRHAVSKLEEAIGADRLNWAAGIHRNTDNPHVHVAVQKEFFDKNFERRLLTKIPNGCLPHYEKNGDEKTFAPGILIEAATEKLDEIILEKAQNQSKQNSSPQRSSQNFATRENQKPERNETKSATETGEKPNLGVERDVLARAILAKFYLEKSQENLDSLETNGHLRRFKITDAVTGKKRQMSLFDLERRAEKSAASELKKLNVSDAAKKDEITKKLVAGELDKNGDSIKRIRTILHNLIVKENQNLASRESDYKKVKPAAEQIRQNCRRENRKLPIPNLTAAEVEMLQDRSIEKRDVRLANYFENVRRNLARERGTPTRGDEEIRRLKALRIVSQLKVQSQEKRLKDSFARKRFASVEIDGEKWSLGKADALIEKRRVEEQKLAGKIGKVLSKIGLVEENQTSAKLEEIKIKVEEKLTEKNEQAATQLHREKNILKTLEEFYKNDTHAGKESLEPKFTASELAEIESFAFELKNARVYGENWRHQKEFIENAGAIKTGESAKDLKQKTVAGRAVAREIMCETETARAKEELSLFQKNKIFQKFEVTDAKTGAARFVSLKEVEFDARGSILDQTLEFFTETSEKRRTRRALEKLVKEKESELKENLKSAREMLKVAGAETVDYKQKSIFGSVKYSVVPVFTPKELITLEIRIKQTENKSEAKNLQKILEIADYANSKNLSAILEKFVDENRVSKTAAHETEKGQIEKQSDVQTGTKTPADRREISESKIHFEHDAVRETKAADNYQERGR